MARSSGRRVHAEWDSSHLDCQETAGCPNRAFRQRNRGGRCPDTPLCPSFLLNKEPRKSLRTHGRPPWRLQLAAPLALAARQVRPSSRECRRALPRSHRIRLGPHLDRSGRKPRSNTSPVADSSAKDLPNLDLAWSSCLDESSRLERRSAQLTFSRLPYP